MDFTDRSTASDAEFADRIEPFATAPYPVEVFLACATSPTRPTSLRPVGSRGRRRDTTSEEEQRG